MYFTCMTRAGGLLWRKMQFGWTALMRAACETEIHCMQLLLEAGAEMEAKDNVRGMMRVFSDMWHGLIHAYENMYIITCFYFENCIILFKFCGLM